MAEQSPLPPEPALSFGGFRVLPRQRLVLEAGRPLRLGSRALDILLVLVERPGERLSKGELIARVWRDTHVVEGNLKFQVAALRRALRDGQDGRRFIETSQGQGYCFVAPVTVEGMADAPAEPDTERAPEPATSLEPLIGRDEVVAKVVERIGRYRLVTLVGPGGIGKSSVARAVADRRDAAGEHGHRVVELAGIVEPALVVGAVAAALGLDVRPGLTVADVAAALRGRGLLLLLDDCAHLVDAVASAVAALLRRAPHLRILATSREPLRVHGEHVVRLPPLECPPATGVSGAGEALRYPAVQLFVEVASANSDEFRMTDDDAPLVADICRQLDGVPLAIELAAARVGVLGLRGLEVQLADRLRVLAGGRRTGLPQHRTMRAALDWSYDLLSPPEQAVFRRLGAFADTFTLPAAAVIAADEDVPPADVVPHVIELATKSLVVTEADEPEPCFRLLQTIRAYAREKLAEGGEAEHLARRHATFWLNLCEAAAEGGSEPELADVNTALAWAFSPAGDRGLGIRLAAAALPCWMAASRLGEGQPWLERALEGLDDAGLRGTREELVLQAGVGIITQLVKGVTAEAEAALLRALELARSFDAPLSEFQVLESLWIYRLRIGAVGEALGLARLAEDRAKAAAAPDVLASAGWMLGVTLHLSGLSNLARPLIEERLRQRSTASRRLQIRHAGFDEAVATHFMLGHVLWIEGRPTEAFAAVRDAVADAHKLGHPTTLCSALAWGSCTLSLHAGDYAEAAEAAAELVEVAEVHALADPLLYGRAVQAIAELHLRRTEATQAEATLALERWRATKWHVFLPVSLFAQAAAALGLEAEMLREVDDALLHAEHSGPVWIHPELLRVKGELLWNKPSQDQEGVREYLLRAFAHARDRGALAWQLKAAISLARFDRGRKGQQMSSALLVETCQQFGAEADTADLRVARHLLTRFPSLVGPQMPVHSKPHRRR
ncbi:winged helix-turn-helix domain-containing protein [Roseomonas sp. CCTCC AB2023176]|uniref:ATP-binding protein n=1 Tax=Roseomonas sp. CCTCC AB2023176 TaxID=3342640 RepID=UPI0035DF8956